MAENESDPTSNPSDQADKTKKRKSRWRRPLIIVIAILAAFGTAEEAHFSTAWKRDQQIDHLNPGFKNTDGGVLLGKFGCFTMDRHHLFLAYRPQTINRSADHVQYAPKAGFTHRHHNLITRIFYLLPSRQAVGYIHGNGSDHIVTQMLGDLNNQVVRFIIY